MQFNDSYINNMITVGNAVVNLSKELELINGFELPYEQSRQLISNITQLPYNLVDHDTSQLLTNTQRSKIIAYLKTDPLIPVPYYLGYSVVTGINICVKKNITLLPGTETHRLIEIISSLLPSKSGGVYLDIGTGSGVLAVCVALTNPSLSVMASDISEKALKVAKHNVEMNNLSSRIKLFSGSWLSPFLNMQEIRNSVDVVSANPPYVKTNKISGLPKSFSSFVPKLAIDGGLDGLDGFRYIIKQSIELLKENGKLILQADEKQVDVVKELILRFDAYNKIKIYKGTNNEDRFVVASKKIA